MNPILLQKQLKENAADLDEFYKDLKNWGEDMKRKDASQIKSVNDNDQNSKKRRSTSVEKKLATSKKNGVPEKSKIKVGCTDYSAWEKFDVEAECEKLDYDENEESELTDECDETQRDQAYVEKEKGNKHVKNEQWEEAIKCYTKAIDCYSYDPIFYANRALCFFKIKDMIKAESDCTMSLKLDKTYVKAYQRRAAAREALSKLEEAERDYLKVLELEPKNKETKTALEKLRKKMGESQKVTETVQRPVSKFTASRQQKRINMSIISPQNNVGSDVVNSRHEEIAHQKREIDVGKSNHWPSGDDNIILVKTVNKPVHLRSKKPLKRIEILENLTLNKEQTENKQTDSFPKTNQLNTTLKTDDLRIIERKDIGKNNCEIVKECKNQANTSKMNEEQVELCVPKSSVQFYSQWKCLKTLENKYIYMKLIEPQQLPYIFKESLESSVFSEVLEVLAKCFISNGDKIFNYLLFFTKVRRFSTLTMFMTDNDKNYVRKLIDYITEHENQAKEDVEYLVKIYEL